MNSQNDKEGSGHVRAAVIGGLFAVLAACIGGIFLLLNTMVDNGVIVFGMSNPSAPETATVTTSQSQENILPTSRPTETETASILQNPSPTLSLSPTETLPTALLPHKIKGIGTGIFEQATYSDGNAPFSQQELNSSHFEIQLLNPDTISNGCGTSWYSVNEVWFGGASKTTLYLNGTAVGEIFQGVGKHGYMIPLSVNAGDELCVNPVPPGGFHMNLGADIYYHYDSFCYRGYC